MKKGVSTTRRFPFRSKVAFTTKAKNKSVTTTTRNAKTRKEDIPVDGDESAESSSNEEESEDKANHPENANGDKQEKTAESDPFAWVGDTRATVEKEGRGEICELHSYDWRSNSKGERVTLRTGSKHAFDEEEEKSPGAALVFNRRIFSGKVETTFLEIKSPYIIKALKEVIGYYPGVIIDSERSIQLYQKPECLFHYRSELRKYAEAADDESTKLHVLFCLKYMEKALHQEISTYDNMMQSDNPRMNFEDLWMVFKPGTLVYTRDRYSEFVYKFTGMDREKHDDGREFWDVGCQQIQSNGKAFGFIEKCVEISKFDGFKALRDLIIFPLEYHPSHESVREKLTCRGRKYASLSGVHYRMYDGVQISETTDIGQVATLKQLGEGARQVRHRIMVDGHEYNANYRSAMLQFAHDKIIRTESDEDNLSEKQYLMCCDRVAGFSLTTKTWGFFIVDGIGEIEFNSTAFDKLALAPEKKDMIAALVRAGQESAASYDDMIRGKGKGIIFLLHGPPGVGKTFTTESIAELLQLPLYALSCSDFGMFVGHTEQRLSAALALATKWNALVLIDEADVFMAERSLNDLARNELVSVFLRVLEYFEGILFLTTNRANTIDPALKSRIHFTLAYPNLSTEAKCDLWSAFIAQGPVKEVPDWVDRDFLARVAKHNMNGRQIKNAVRVAFALAHNKSRGLLPGDILSVLDSGTSFKTSY